MRERDELDRLLDEEIDAALTAYVDAEVRTGLVQRVLAVTSWREPRSDLRWLPMAVGALAAALVVTVLVVHRVVSRAANSPVAARVTSSTFAPVVPGNESRPRGNTSRAEAQDVVGVLTARLKPCRFETSRSSKFSASCERGRGADSALAATVLPRRDVFPTPSPLTAEEQAVLKLGNRGLGEVPAQEVRAQTIQSVPEEPVDPIHIAAIHIPLLNPPDSGN